MDAVNESNKVLKILAIGDGDTVSFALSELEKYLERMEQTEIRVLHRIYYDETEKGIWVGKTSKFDQIVLPEKTDDQLDDFIYIDVNEGCGIISGNNRRSILFAVYRYLTVLGCRWVRPGSDGEYIPSTNYSLKTVKVVESPSYRYRVICIEGSVSLEHGIDLIDWMPKVGLNGFMIPFKDGYIFFERWYRHENNPLKEQEPYSPEIGAEYTRKLIAEIKTRGLLYHAVGHSWENAPLGLYYKYSLQGDYSKTEGISQYFAMIDGERRIWDTWGMDPNNTHMCYSNPKVRTFMAESVVDYIEEHHEVDLLHFWLDDGIHNFCECENCKKANPSDFYVMIMNEIDDLLTKKGLDTKIVFVVYFDLLWSPIKERLKNQNRFILLFAPISRSYSLAISCDKNLQEVEEYQVNKSPMPKNAEGNLAYLAEWKKWFKGDSFIFEYHLWHEHYKDFGNMQITNVLSQDIKNIGGWDLNGLMGVTTIRPFLPNGLGMTVLGRTLWQKDLELEAIAEDYFISAYGKGGLRCMEYLKKLSEFLNPPYLRGERPLVDVEASRQFGEIPAFVEEFKPIIEKNLRLDNACHAKSWEYLYEHGLIVSKFAGVLKAFAAGEIELSMRLWEELKFFICENEDKLFHVFDVYMFIRWVGSYFEWLQDPNIVH
jgi:hypothetical protein